MATEIVSKNVRHTFLVGRRIYLRPMEMPDLKGPYFDWLNDYEVTRFLETGSFPTTRATLRHYLESVARHPENVMLAILDKKTGTHVGNIKLGPIHPIHRRGDVGIMIGDKKFWGKGYGSEAIALIVEYGFKRLNLHKITLGVYADHTPAVRVYQKLGFVIEGILKEQLFRDGQFRDKAVMGILRTDYTAKKQTKNSNGHGA